MSFLGRPSAGDSPFAIGDRAMRDTSSPQPPMQRNPTPKQPYQPESGSLAAPSPYGSSSVSNEARRRYEERYARKRQEEEDKRRQEEEAARRAANPPPRQYQPQPQQQWGQPPNHGGQQPQFTQHQAQPQHHPQPQFTQHQQPQSPSQQPQAQFARPPPRGDSFRNSTYGQPPARGASPANQQYNPARGPSPQQSAAAFAQQHRQNSQPQQQQQVNPRHSGQQVDPRNPRHSGNQQQWQQGGYQTPPPQGPPGGQFVTSPQQQRQQPQQPPQQQQHQQAQQGYQTPTPPMSEQGGDQELRHLFNQFDSTRTGQLSHWDLRHLLEKDATMEAREDCVKMLMNIFDTDRSGSINFMEFEGLYRYIQDWHGIFKRFDQDESGLIDRRELHAALQGFGFSLPVDMVAKLEKRFAPPAKLNEGPGNGISFDRFLMACVTVKHYTEAFRRFDPNNTGVAQMDYNTFMDVVMDAPS